MGILETGQIKYSYLSWFTVYSNCDLVGEILGDRKGGLRRTGFGKLEGCYVKVETFEFLEIFCEKKRNFLIYEVLPLISKYSVGYMQKRYQKVENANIIDESCLKSQLKGRIQQILIIDRNIFEVNVIIKHSLKNDRKQFSGNFKILKRTNKIDSIFKETKYSLLRLELIRTQFERPLYRVASKF